MNHWQDVILYYMVYFLDVVVVKSVEEWGGSYLFAGSLSSFFFLLPLLELVLPQKLLWGDKGEQQRWGYVFFIFYYFFVCGGGNRWFALPFAIYALYTLSWASACLVWSPNYSISPSRPSASSLFIHEVVPHAWYQMHLIMAYPYIW